MSDPLPPPKRMKTKFLREPRPLPRTRKCPVRTNNDGIAAPEKSEISLSRSHLLAALKTLENDQLRQKAPKQPYHYRRRQLEMQCSADLSILPGTFPMSLVRSLKHSLINSVYRHDWPTAARILQMMLGIISCHIFVYRTVCSVLFNHPQAGGETIQEFLSQVLNLRSRPEQLNFLQKLFFLPDDLKDVSEYGDRFDDEEYESD